MESSCLHTMAFQQQQQPHHPWSPQVRRKKADSGDVGVTARPFTPLKTHPAGHLCKIPKQDDPMKINKEGNSQGRIRCEARKEDQVNSFQFLFFSFLSKTRGREIKLVVV